MNILFLHHVFMYVSIRLKAELIADKSALIIIINALVFSKLFYCSLVVPPLQMNLIWTNSKQYRISPVDLGVGLENLITILPCYWLVLAPS